MKKKPYVTQIPNQNRYIKLFLIMKFSLLLNLVCSVAISANSFSQNNSFSMNYENATVKDIFRSIESQSDYRFFYNDELSDLNRIVDLNVRDLNITEVLDKLFLNTGISYTILENNLIVIAPMRSGQQKIVTGMVTDQLTGEPLAGVNIIIEGTTQGTITGVDGNYSIEISDSPAVLVFTFIGYLTEKVEVGNQTKIDMSLAVEVSELSEVVVVGYGTQKKVTITGSVSSAKGDEVSDSPVANISNSIAGRISGISMKSNGGQPGEDNPDIHIRGIATTGNSAPLVVVDGIIRNNINQIDPNTIESVTVLKDAAAVAPYGMGGANGVILITTKSGKAGEPSLSFSTYYGIQTPNYRPDMLSSKDYLTLVDSATGSNHSVLISNYDSLHSVDPDAYPNSNFYKDVADLTVPIQNYDLQLSGGDERTRYFAGLGYYKQDGMFENLGYQRYSYNLKVESQATKTTKVMASLQGSVEDIKRTRINADDILWWAIKFIPTNPMRFSNGLWGASDGASPIGTIKTGGYNNGNINTLLSSISIDQQIPFIKGLSLKVAFSYDPTETMDKSWSTPVIYYQLDDPSVYPHTYSEIVPADAATTLTETYTKSVNNTYQAYINYKNTFGKHEITLLGVAEAQKSSWKNLSASNLDYTIPIDEIELGSSDNAYFDIGGGSKTGSQIGYVYRVGYNYDNRYIIEAAGRYDGHYTFAPGKRKGYFPSFSAAWRISEEKLLKDKFKWLHSLKIRGSWGKSGNLPYDEDGNLAEFFYLNGYVLYPNAVLPDPAYAFGTGTLVSGSYIPRESNPYITWEASEKTDVGFDLSLWKGMVTLEADYFHEERDNMLIRPISAVPVEYGLRLALVNAGIMSNNGAEFSVTGSYKFENGIHVGLTGNYSYAKNKVIKTFEDPTTYENPNRRRTGRQLDTPFGYQSEGLFTTDDDINHDGVIDSLDGYDVIQFGTLYPGDVRYADLNGDGIIDPNDETVIGNPRYPSVTYGFTPTFAWKGFDLSLFFQGTAKVSTYIANFQTQPFSNNKSNSSYEYYDNYWRPDRQDGIYPRLTSPLTVNNTQYSDFWMRNSGYLRLKNAVLGYKIPSKIIRRVGIKTLRAYFSGQNMLTFSKIKFMDPEEAERNTAATYFYPITKVYTLGLDVTF